MWSLPILDPYFSNFDEMAGTEDTALEKNAFNIIFFSPFGTFSTLATNEFQKKLKNAPPYCTSL